MSMGTKLSNEVIAWSTLAMVIVIISIILLKVGTVDTVACASGLPSYVAAENLCCYTLTDCTTGNASLQALNSDLSTYVSAFSEPRNWIIIVIIAIIGIGLIAYFRKTLKN